MFLQSLRSLSHGNVMQSTARCLGYRNAPAQTCSPQGICNVCVRTLFFHCHHDSPRDCHSSKNLQPNSSICYHQGGASCFFPQPCSGISMLGELPAELSAVQETVRIHRPLSPRLWNLTQSPKATEIILDQTNTSERFRYKKIAEECTGHTSAITADITKA